MAILTISSFNSQFQRDIPLLFKKNVRLFQLETWMKTNLVSLLNNYGSDDLTTSETSTSWNYLFMLVSIKWNMIILTGRKSKLIKTNISPKQHFKGTIP